MRYLKSYASYNMCSQVFLKFHLNQEEKVERSRKSLKVSNIKKK